MKKPNPYSLQLNAKRFYQQLQVKQQAGSDSTLKVKQRAISFDRLKVKKEKISRTKSQTQREPIESLVNSNRQLLVRKLVIGMKREAMQNNSVQLRSKKEQLQAQKEMFHKDKKLLDTLVDQILRERQQMKLKLQSLRNQQQSLYETESSLNNQVQKLNSSIGRNQHYLKNLQAYKQFVQRIVPVNCKVGLNILPSSFYLTQLGLPTERQRQYYPHHLAERIKQLEENNLIEIQTNYEIGEELDRQYRDLCELRQTIRRLDQNYAERSKALTLQLEKEKRQRTRLREKQMEQLGEFQVLISEGHIDMKAVCSHIVQAYKQIISAKVQPQLNSTTVKSMFKEIQDKVMGEPLGLVKKKVFQMLSRRKTDEGQIHVGRTRLQKKGNALVFPSRRDMPRLILRRKPRMLAALPLYDQNDKYFCI